MRALLIAEKPSLAKAVMEAVKMHGFCDQLDFFALHGHIMSLYNPADYREDWQKWTLETLPMIPEEFIYKVSDERTYNNLLAQLRNNHYDYLINCCDPDREGQHIFYSIYDSLKLSTPVKRMWHNDLSDTELVRALNEMEDDLTTERLVNLKDASKLRAQMDWLVGMNASRIVTLKRRDVTRLGRVMTPTFKMLCDRERAIRAFDANTSYGVEAEYTEGFKGRLVEKKEDKIEPVLFDNKLKAQQKVDSLPKEGIVESVDKKATSEKAPQLPSLADIQADANREFGFTLDKTLSLVQSLYEKKMVSYPRTDCCYITEAISKDFGRILNSLRQVECVKLAISTLVKEDLIRIQKDKNYVNDAKVTAHYALIPTGTVVKEISDDEEKIYQMICKRFVCIFLPAYQVERTRVLVRVDDSLFQSNGLKVIRKGYRGLLNTVAKEELLPELANGQICKINQFVCTEHTTKAPSRFTDASLLNAMINAANYIEDKELSDILKGDQKVKDSGGIGTPATRAAIVEKLVQPVMNQKDQREYYLCYRKGKSFYVSDEGLDLMDSLDDFDIASPELTAVWEQKLRGIESGEVTTEQFVASMKEYIVEMTETMINASYMLVSGTYLKAKCPICSSRVKAANNYYLCEKYGKEEGCGFILPKKVNHAVIKEKTVEAICNGETTAPLKMKSEKTGKDYYASLKFNGETKRVDLIFEQDHYIKSVCPICGGRIISRNNFYVCENFKNEEKNCSFILAKSINNAAISEKNLELLVSGKETAPLKMKSNKTGNEFYAAVKYDKETGKTELVFENEHPTKYNCPGCGGKIVLKQNYYVCENYLKDHSCGFVISKTVNGAPLKEKMLADLCANEQTETLKMKSEKTGNEFYAGLKYNKETGKIDYVFESGQTLKCTCPICKENIISTKNYYMCDTYLKDKSCSFVVAKEFHGAKVTDRMIATIANLETTAPVRIKSEKTGKSYYAGLRFNPETKRIGLEFEDGHPTKYKCPVCQGTLLKKSGSKDDYLMCENQDFSVNYTISNRKLKEAEMKELLEVGELKCDGFKSKTGKEFSSKLIIENGRVTFYFGKKKDE